QHHAGFLGPSRGHGCSAVSSASARLCAERSQRRTPVSTTAMKRTIFLGSISLIISAIVFAQITGVINKRGEKPAIAVPDLRGAGDAQRFMDAFNSTLSRDL